MSRTVTVYNTIGSNQILVESSATTWGELQQDLDLRGVSYHGMKVVVGETQVSLESSAAQLPTTAFRLFLMPQKVKSGFTPDSEECMIDWEDGINWQEFDWSSTDNIPEDYTFKTKKDLTVARAKKAQSYLNKVIDYLIQDEKKTMNDPEVVNLQKTADEIQRNMGLFD